MTKPTISIIVIVYNAEATIDECLANILKSSIKKQIIIIDNNSTDNTREVSLKALGSSENTFITNNNNFGFAAAVNQGAKIAKGEYLLFLNPDTVVKKGCIEEMVSFLKEKKDAAVAGCKVLNPNGSLQPSCGSFPTIINIILDKIPVLNTLFKTELLRQKNFYNEEQTPDWVSGVFFMTKRDIFLKLGGFDERYFMYVEDVDFCYRARSAGYKIYYNPKAEIIHYDQGKSTDRRKFKAQQMRKGFSIFFEKYKSSYYLFLWKMILALESVYRPNLKLK